MFSLDSFFIAKSSDQLAVYVTQSFICYDWGAAVAQWVKRWPTELAVLSLSLAQDKIFSTADKVPLHTAFIIIHSLS